MPAARSLVACVALVLLGCAAPGAGGAPAPPGDADAALPAEPVGPTPERDAAAPVVPDAGARDAAAAEPPARPTPDAGAVDVVAFARCAAHPGALCDDFEAIAVGARPGSPWKVSGPGTLLVDDRMAHSGRRAVHVSVDPTHDSAGMTETASFPIAGGTVYVRFFVYFARQIHPEPSNNVAMASGTYMHWGVLHVDGPYDFGGKTYHPTLRLFGGENQHIFMNLGGGPFAADSGAYDTRPPPGQRELPGGTWICVEAMARTSPAEARFWWDGVEHPSLHVLGMAGASNGAVPFAVPRLDSVTLGWMHAFPRTIEPIELWIDDVAVAPERLGCEP